MSYQTVREQERGDSEQSTTLWGAYGEEVWGLSEIGMLFAGFCTSDLLVSGVFHMQLEKLNC